MRIVAIGMLCFCLAGDTFCQPSSTQATFEVASVKPSAPGVPGMFTRFLPDGSVRITGATLKSLIAIAYSVRVFQVTSGPQWIETECFDIEARPETGEARPDAAKLREEQRKTGERLRNLLADRFQLALHRETREQPVYELVVAKGGPKFEQATEGTTLIRMYRGTLRGQSVGIRMLALNLSNELGHHVIDKTGLVGNYDFAMKCTPIPRSAATLDSAQADGLESDKPSVFTALQEQLGLRLVAGKGPVEVLSIDRVERPSNN